MGAFGLALVMASMPMNATAQEVPDPDACRCVDARGEEIEDCTCFRSPRIDPQALVFGAPRPRLGISVDGGQAAGLDAEGALVTDVLSGGPADEAGIREGDVIVELDGRPLTEPMGAEAEEDFDLDRSIPVQRLLAIAQDLTSGEDVEVVYLRDGRRERTTVLPEDLSDRWGQGFSMTIPRFDVEGMREGMRGLYESMGRWRGWDGDDARVFSPGMGWGPDVTGLGLVEVNPELGAYFGTDEGVLVTDVQRNSALGLEPGDVVLAVGDRAVTSPERFRRVVSSYGQEEEIRFRIMRDGEETMVTGRFRY
jgi:membrane-associated protease RseP (regulator of RpoE activity)